MERNEKFGITVCLKNLFFPFDDKSDQLAEWIHLVFQVP